MKKIFTFILTCVITIFSTSSNATPESEALTVMLNNIHAMQADFVQSILDSKKNTLLQKIYGKMALQRPGRFRWEVTKPNPQLIVTSGIRLWIYDKDLEQATVRKLATASTGTPALLLTTTSADIEKDFKIQKSESSNTQWFTLYPKDADSMFNMIRLGFVNNVITEMWFQDHLGHDTHIQFHNVKTDMTLPASLFEFKPPRGVDIIDESQQRKKH